MTSSIKSSTLKSSTVFTNVDDDDCYTQFFYGSFVCRKCLKNLKTLSSERVEGTIEGFRAKRAYIAFWPIFIFCRIELIFGRLTCFDMKSIVP